MCPNVLLLFEHVTNPCALVLDPRTRQILFKMVNKGFVDHVHGAISTGKEANVYHATRNNPTGDDEADVAIKVYKTSILVFKDREQYISGDYRFSNGCSKGNPRKMVSLACAVAAVPLLPLTRCLTRSKCGQRRRRATCRACMTPASAARSLCSCVITYWQ